MLFDQTILAGPQTLIFRFSSALCFRAGKAPASMVTKYYSSDIRQQILEALVPKYFSKRVDDEQLRVVGPPNYKDVHFHEGTPRRARLVRRNPSRSIPAPGSSSSGAPRNSQSVSATSKRSSLAASSSLGEQMSRRYPMPHRNSRFVTNTRASHGRPRALRGRFSATCQGFFGRSISTISEFSRSRS